MSPSGKYSSTFCVELLYIIAPVPIPLDCEPVAIVLASLNPVVISGKNTQGEILFNPDLLKSTVPVKLSPTVPKPICDVLPKSN